jgi:hypothetical protein
MSDVLLAVLHLAVVGAKLCGAGGVRAVTAENLLIKAATDRLAPLSAAGAEPDAKRPAALRILGTVPQAATHPQGCGRSPPVHAAAFHQAKVRRQERQLFSSRPSRNKPGPTGPDPALIQVIVELKSSNPRFGCPRIARIVTQTSGIAIDRNVVHRVLAKHYRSSSGRTGPSWLSFIGHTADRLWSVDLFRCESIVLHSYWVLVVMDQFIDSSASACTAAR